MKRLILSFFLFVSTHTSINARETDSYVYLRPTNIRWADLNNPSVTVVQHTSGGLIIIYDGQENVFLLPGNSSGTITIDVHGFLEASKIWQTPEHTSSYTTFEFELIPLTIVSTIKVDTTLSTSVEIDMPSGGQMSILFTPGSLDNLGNDTVDISVCFTNIGDETQLLNIPTSVDPKGKLIQPITRFDLTLIDKNTGQEVNLNESIIVSVPILPGSAKQGDVVQSFYYEKLTGAWKPQDYGHIEVFSGELYWVASLPHLSLWQGGIVSDEQTCLNVSVCLDYDCTQPVPDHYVEIVGHSYSYGYSNFTDASGKVVFTVKTNSEVNVTTRCTINNETITIQLNTTNQDAECSKALFLMKCLTCNGFMCGSGECIGYDTLCNGKMDCSDGSDEFNCTQSGCVRIMTCSDDKCLTYVPDYDVNVLDISSGKIEMYTTNDNGTVCVAATVGESVTVSALCEDGSMANATVTPESTGNCQVGTCSSVALILQCRVQTTQLPESFTTPYEMGCVRIKTCGDEKCLEPVMFRNISVLEISSGRIQKYTTNENGTVCVAATVDESVTVSALCEDGSMANATVTPESTGDCQVGTCSSVALILQCRVQTTQLPESFTTPYAMGCVRIKTCGDEKCLEPVMFRNISVLENSSGRIEKYTTNENGTVCVAATVGESLTVSALCEDRSMANATITPESTGDCQVGTCSSVALILQCRVQTTQLPQSFTTPYEMGCVRIKTCGDEKCLELVMFRNISVLEISSGRIEKYTSNENGTVCVAATVGESVTVFALCEDGSVANATVTPESTGDCQVGTCSSVALILQCRLQTTQLPESFTTPYEMGCVRIKTCGDEKCLEPVMFRNISVLDISSGRIEKYTTNENGTVCVAATVGESVTVSALCEDGSMANATVTPESTGNCQVGTCSSVALILQCRVQTTQLPESFTTPYEMGCVRIKTCGDEKCLEPVMFRNISVLEISSGRIEKYTTNENSTVCVAATVGESLTVSALCEDGSIANATLTPETTGDCVVGTCSEVALILQCREQTTQLPETFTTPYAMGCVHIQTCADDQCLEPHVGEFIRNN
ncbi:uncharacterized protein [Antedon mediterranea]|uniref:uncharacterized protein n=1 Tax=Antedon mediterranea TaxID=105859 RepID=UPI003AF90FAD